MTFRRVMFVLLNTQKSIAIVYESTVVFRGPIFCCQCFQIPLDLILSYCFIIMFINKKSLFFTTYMIFQTRTITIQWAIFGPKVSDYPSGITGDRTFFMPFGTDFMPTWKVNFLHFYTFHNSYFICTHNRKSTLVRSEMSKN